MDAYLKLEDGSVFKGRHFGAKKSVAGEVVFNTGMTGYPESLTDPSYKGQILAFTYPLIGNYGVPPETRSQGISDFLESEKIQAEGVIVASEIQSQSHWQAKNYFNEWLEKQSIPGISGIDTRALTQKIREKGTMLGKITTSPRNTISEKRGRLKERNLVAEVSVDNPQFIKSGKKTVALIDCGVKHGILRFLIHKGVSVWQTPWNFNIFEKTIPFDGIVFSNGPGDPSTLKETVKTMKMALTQDKPVLGICLGSQIMGLALGAKTFKLKYGHRGHNQPCQDQITKKCVVTSQNHGYAVDPKNLPKDWLVWFKNLNDGTVEGLKHKHKPFFSVQFHPEASPGPTDTNYILEEFIEML